METTRLTVEYLIIGILVSVAILFLFASTSPLEMQALWVALVQSLSLINVGILILILPVFYGLGIVTEYLGMFLFDGFLARIKDRRFEKYISDNLSWVSKSRLLSGFVEQGTAVLPEAAGQRMYGQMRFFILMNNAYLYEEIKAQINRYRILRALIIVEILFIIGFLIRLLGQGLNSLSLFFSAFIIVLLVITIRGLMDRYNRYCRAIEHSFKALALDEFNLTARNKPG